MRVSSRAFPVCPHSQICRAQCAALSTKSYLFPIALYCAVLISVPSNKLGKKAKEAGSRACLFASEPGNRYLRSPLDSERRRLTAIDNLEQRSVYTGEIKVPFSECLSFFPGAGLLDRVDKRFSRHRLKPDCG